MWTVIAAHVNLINVEKCVAADRFAAGPSQLLLLRPDIL